MDVSEKRDHGGGLDAAVALFGGERDAWLDLSTGINPVPFEVPVIPDNSWTALPDVTAAHGLIAAARRFWQVPDALGILAVPGASAAIAHMPRLATPGHVHIPGPTYNEHAASFAAAGWNIAQDPSNCAASVHVHPNNPDGRLWQAADPIGDLRIIDESFCDVAPGASMIAQARTPGTLVLKSFGKFWGLAGVRLGFVIGAQAPLEALAEMLGPWPVAGPALHIGAAALNDLEWADTTRNRLAQDSDRLDRLMRAGGAGIVGGTTLFRLYEVNDAAAWQTRLAHHHIWSRIFPYNPSWLRLGLPAPDKWSQLESALK